MHGMYWGERKVGEWTDREWSRLQAVKNGERLEDPSGKLDSSVLVNMKSDLREKVKRYAEAHNISVLQLIRETLYILMQ
jgi:hypothetical protein